MTAAAVAARPIQKGKPGNLASEVTLVAPTKAKGKSLPGVSHATFLPGVCSSWHLRVPIVTVGGIALQIDGGLLQPGGIGATASSGMHWRGAAPGGSLAWLSLLTATGTGTAWTRSVSEARCHATDSAVRAAAGAAWRVADSHGSAGICRGCGDGWLPGLRLRTSPGLGLARTVRGRDEFHTHAFGLRSRASVIRIH